MQYGQYIRTNKLTPEEIQLCIDMLVDSIVKGAEKAGNRLDMGSKEIQYKIGPDGEHAILFVKIDVDEHNS